MDTNLPKTPATLPFAAWQAMTPTQAAGEVHARIDALSPGLRRAALAWLRPETELAAELATVGGPDAQPSHLHPLRGIPYLLKDLFDLTGLPTRAGSTFLHQVRPTPKVDSAIARRLRDLGAACVGKTHLVEFAAGLFGDNSHSGDCPHPRFPDRLSGGSSSGSAALVAAGVVPLAVGTDTGGSVRVPAAFCGLYGFRMSPGEEFVRDAVPLSPAMDTAGWFTAHAADMLTAWESLALGRAKPTGREPRGCFLPAASWDIPFDPDTATACDRAAAALAPAADHATISGLRSSWQHAIEAYTVRALSEAYLVHRDWLAPYQQHYEPGIWQRFSDGRLYRPEQLAAMQATFAAVRQTWDQYFATYDFLVLPATPFPAPIKADCTPEARRQLLTLTTPASLGGCPVLTLPVPLPSGLTAGLQVIVPLADSPAIRWLLRQ